MSWRKGRSISPIFASTPTLAYESLPYHIGARETEHFLSYKSRSVPIELKSLIYVDQLFVKKSLSHLTWYMGKRKSYKITDHHGRTIFTVEKRLKKFNFLKPKELPIQYNVYSEQGLVLSLRGHPAAIGTGGSISTKLIKSGGGRIHLGDVVQEVRFWEPIFSVHDADGHSELSIQGPSHGSCFGLAPERSSEFNICRHKRKIGINGMELEERVTVIGQLCRNYVVCMGDFTRSMGENLDVGTVCKWSLKFPRELDPVGKVLVIAGLFLIESQYYA